jgi:integrase
LKEGKTTFPIRIKSGSASVSIYDRSDAYPYYRVAHYVGSQRQMKPFTRLVDARRQARQIAEQISAGEARAIRMSRADELIYQRAREAVAPLGLALDTAAIELAQARRLLGDTPVAEAARFYLNHGAHHIMPKTPAEIVEELIAQKRADGMSERYCDDLRYRCGRFARAFQCEIGSITPALVQQFLNRLNLSARSVNNFRKTLKTLFEFARARRYLSKEIDLLEGISRQREHSTIEIYTPQEMAALLLAATGNKLLSIALRGFAGLRSAELERLQWNQIRLGAEPHLIVNADQAKTRSRRLVPISDNLAAWLAPYARKSGSVWPHGHDYLYESQRAVARKAGVKWKQNALRHSFISYRMAMVRDANQVALEAGNSPDIIFRNYLELVTRTQARSWFGIEPEARGKVISINSAS